MNKKKVGIIAAIAAGVLALGGVGAFVLPKVLKPAEPETSLEETLPIESGTEPSTVAPTTENVTYPEGITWYDVNAEVVEISSKQDLLDLTELSYFFDFAGQTVKLTDDIVLNEGNASDWVTERPDTIFHPIRNFAGTFDGQGHTISGVFIAGGDMKLAMFVNMKDTGVVENLRVENSLIQSIGSMGAATFATGSNGTLRRLYSSATIVVDGGRVAGISAQPAGGTVEECWFDGEITSTGRYAGGIVDELINDVQLNVRHCLYTGMIHNDWNRSSSSIGGIVGCTQTRAILRIDDCFSDGELDLVNKVRVGTILGGDANNGNTTSIINNCFATTDNFSTTISSVATGIQGGAVGMARSKILGKNAYSWLLLDFDKYWTTVEEDTPHLQAFSDTIETYDGVAKIFNVDWYDENKDEFEIHTLGELFGLAIKSYSTDFYGKTVKLAEDIVINEDYANFKNWGKAAPEMTWMSIGNQGTPFAGTFDGQGHTVYGMYYVGGAMSGFFANTSEFATVKNLNLKNAYVATSSSNSGIVAGRGNGTYDTIYTNGILVLRTEGTSAATGIGGIIGQIQMGTGVVNNCWFDGRVEIHGENAQQAGGVVGHCVNTAALKMSNCLNTGTVTGDRPQNIGFNNLGGLVGFIGDNGTFECDGVLGAGKVEHLAGGCGSVFGHFGGNAYSTVKASYGIAGMDKATLGTNRGTVNGIVETMQKDKMTGFKAYQWTDLDFENYWAVNVNGLPVLKTWATSDPSVAGYSKMYDTSWYDPDQDEFVLTTWQQLIGFSKLSMMNDFEGKTVKMGSDIVMNARDASTYASKAPSVQFTGIGSTAKPFKGTFDGQGHILSGVYMLVGSPCGGFFNATAQPAVVKDVRMLNSYFESSVNAVGSFAGRGNGSFMNLYSDAILNGVETSQGYGGIIGQVNAEDETSYINYCWFNGKINVVEGSSTQQIGGILGQVINNGSAVVEHCLFTGEIEARRSIGAVNVGGIAGIAVGSKSATKKYSPQLKVIDCFADGTIIQKGGLTGAIVGQAGFYSRVTVHNSYATRETYSSVVGGVNAENKDRDYKNNGSVFKQADILGAKAYSWLDLNFASVWGCIADETPRLRMMTPADQFVSTDGVMKVDTSWYDPKAKEYVITTRDQLMGLMKVAASDTFKGKTIKLGADINYNDNYEDYKNYGQNAPEFEWTPIFSNASYFEGTFDGQGHAIRGLYIKSTTDYTAFMVESRGTIKNVRFENGYIESSGSRLATVVGRGCGTFEKVYTNCMVVSTSTTTSTSFMGGILGQLTWTDASFSECWSEADIIGTGNFYACGGLVGNLNANKGAPVNVTMKNCLFNGTIESKTSNNLGGLVGLLMNNNDTVTCIMSDCLTVGTINIGSAQNTGSAIGAVTSSQVLSLNHVYAAAGIAKSGETVLKPIESISGSVSGVLSEKPYDDLKGYGGFDNTLLDFDTYWIAIEGKTPELKWKSSETALDCTGRERKDTSWYDPSAMTYWIDTAQKLEYIATQTKASDFAGKTIIIANDIEFNTDHEKFADYATAEPKRIWPGIGGNTLGAKPFAGTIEGCGHTISGLYRAAAANELTGFVTELAETGIVRNLQIKNAYFRTAEGDNVGAVVSTGSGRISNVYTNAILSVPGKSQYVGGIIGNAVKTLDIEKVTFDGVITSDNADSSIVGGIIGGINDATADVKVTDVAFSGQITVNKRLAYAGGIIGRALSGKVAVKNTVSSGSLTNNAANPRYTTSVLAASVNNKSTVSFENVYAVAGTTNTTDSNKTVGTNYHTGTITELELEALKGEAAKTATALDFENTWATVADGAPRLKDIVESDPERDVPDTRWFDPAKNEFTLNTINELLGFSELSKSNLFVGKTIKLGKDIILNEDNANFENWGTAKPKYSWTPIGANSYESSANNGFKGTFDGQGHSIIGLYSKTSDPMRGGLFNITKNATIKNLKLVNCYFENSGTNRFGALVAIGTGTFENIYTNAVLKSTSASAGNIAGFVGQGWGLTMTNCWFDGKIDAAGSSVGGFVGGASEAEPIVMTNCLVTGSISSTSTSDTVRIGGFIAYPFNNQLVVTLKSCLFAGTMSFNSASNSGASILGGANKPNEASKTLAITFENVYAIQNAASNGKTVGAVSETGVTVTGEVTEVAAEAIQGEDAKTALPGLDWNAFTAREGSVPGLK